MMLIYLELDYIFYLVVGFPQEELLHLKMLEEPFHKHTCYNHVAKENNKNLCKQSKDQPPWFILLLSLCSTTYTSQMFQQKKHTKKGGITSTLNPPAMRSGHLKSAWLD